MSSATIRPRLHQSAVRSRLASARSSRTRTCSEANSGAPDGAPVVSEIFTRHSTPYVRRLWFLVRRLGRTKNLLALQIVGGHCQQRTHAHADAGLIHIEQR